MISHCADRYRASFVAALLRGLEYTERRAVLVVPRDGFIAGAVEQAGVTDRDFFHTSGAPVTLKAASLADGPIGWSMVVSAR